MKKTLYFAFVLAAAAACQITIEPSEILEVEEGEYLTFATGLPGSKTTIGARVGNTSPVSWADGDEIGVYVGDSDLVGVLTDLQPSIFTPDAGGASISGVAERSKDDKYYAIYPCIHDGVNDDFLRYQKAGTITFRHTLPARQSGTGAEAVLIAEGDEANGFQFHQATTLFSFTVPAELDGTLKRIEIRANADEALAATYWLNVETLNTGTTSLPSSVIYLEDNGGIEAGTYYLAALPFNLTAGFTMTTFDLNGDRYNHSTYSSAINLSTDPEKNCGGKVLNLKTISADPDPESSPVPYAYNDPAPAFAPVVALMKQASTTALSNATLGANALTFSNLANYSKAGQEIRFSGMTKGKIANSTGENNCFTVTAVSEGATFTYVVPVDNTVYGDVDFGFSISCQTPANVSGSSDWTVDWSKDGASWSPVTALHSYDGSAVRTTANAFKLNSPVTAGVMLAEFNIPEPVSSGTLYVRLTCPCAAPNQTQTVRVNAGYYLLPRINNTTFPSSVVLSENFASSIMPVNMVSGAFLGPFNNANLIAAPLAAGWTGENPQTYRGCIGFATPGNTNNIKSITTPALSSLDETCDVILTFKAAVYTVRTGPTNFDSQTFAVTIADGNGEVGELFCNKSATEDPYNWHVYCCRIKGADASTKIRIGTPAAAQSNRFYLDDIVVTKE